MTCVANAGKVFADPLELCCGHPDCGSVVRVWDAEVFAVDVHEFEFEVRNALLICFIRKKISTGSTCSKSRFVTFALKDKSHVVPTILSTHSDDILVLGTLEHLDHVIEVHACGLRKPQPL